MNCIANAVCDNTMGSYNSTCKQGYYGDGNICCLGNISPAVFFKLVFVLFLSVWTTVSNDKFVSNNYVYRDIDIQ